MNTRVADFVRDCIAQSEQEYDALLDESRSQRFQFSDAEFFTNEDGEPFLKITTHENGSRLSFVSHLRVFLPRLDGTVHVEEARVVSFDETFVTVMMEAVRNLPINVEGSYVLIPTDNITDQLRRCEQLLLAGGTELVTNGNQRQLYQRSSPTIVRALSGSYPEDAEALVEHPDLHLVLNHPALNPEQASVVEEVISKRLSLVKGPPGTGKTTTLAGLLCSLIRLQDEKVLVTAASHTAVDVALETFMQMCREVDLDPDDLNIVRFISPRSPFTVSSGIPADYIFKDNMDENLTRRLSRARVVFTTLNSMLSKKLKLFQPKTLVVDESSQIFPYYTPFFMVRSTRRTVFFGDDMQLSGVSRIRLQHDNVVDYLVSSGYHITMLKTQYRMGPGISELISYMFYGCELKSSESADRRELDDDEMYHPDYSPVMIYTAKSREERDNRNGHITIRNHQQSVMVREVLYRIRNTTDKGILVLCNYRGQLDDIKSTLAQDRFHNVTFRTVDSSQGSEADIVVYCTTRSNGSGQVGFLSDVRRVNVAISRARFSVVIIGDITTLKVSRCWKEIIDIISRFGTIVQGVDFPSSRISSRVDENNNVYLEGVQYELTARDIMHHFYTQLGVEVRILDMYSIPTASSPSPPHIGSPSGNYIIRCADEESRVRLLSLDRVHLRHGLTKYRTRYMLVFPDVPRYAIVPPGQVVCLRRYPFHNDLQRVLVNFQKFFTGLSLLSIVRYRGVNRVCALLFGTVDDAITAVGMTGMSIGCDWDEEEHDIQIWHNNSRVVREALDNNVH